MLSVIDNFAVAHPWVVAAVSLLVGTFLGHVAALRRDRAKEFNALADLVRNQLRSERGDVRYGSIKVDSDSLNTLVDMSSLVGRRRLSAAIAKYKEARQQHTRTYGLGSKGYLKTDHVEAAIDRLLQLLKRR